MSEISISPNTEEGDIMAIGGTWATARNATTGTLNKLVYDMQDFESVKSGINYYIHRGFIAFPLTTIPAGSVINAVHLKLKAYITSGDTCYINLGQQSDTLIAGDFDLATTTNYGSVAGDNAEANRDITFNAAGIAYIQATIGGTAKFCLRNTNDQNDSAPTAGIGETWRNQTYATVSERPLLVVTTAGGSFFIMLEN